MSIDVFFFQKKIPFQPNTVINKIKIAIFVVIWILFTGIFMLKDEKVLEYHPLSVSINESKCKKP